MHAGLRLICSVVEVEHHASDVPQDDPLLQVLDPLAQKDRLIRDDDYSVAPVLTVHEREVECVVADFSLVLSLLRHSEGCQGLRMSRVVLWHTLVLVEMTRVSESLLAESFACDCILESSRNIVRAPKRCSERAGDELEDALADAFRDLWPA